MFDLEKKSAKLPDDNLTKSDYGALTLQRIIDLGRFLLTGEHSYSLVDGFDIYHTGK